MFEQEFSANYFTKNLGEAFIKFTELYQLLANNHLTFAANSSFDYTSLFNAFTEAISKFFSEPEKVMQENIKLMNNYFFLAQNISAKLTGMEVSSIYLPNKKDSRFRDESWEKNIFFNYIMQSYVLFSEWFINIIQNADLDKNLKKKAEFFAKQFIDAMAPSNFIHTNPRVIKEMLMSQGASLLSGLERLKEDIEMCKFPYDIPKTDSNAFKVGVDLATTKGHVIYQNDIMQIIYYIPKCNENFENPILIVPPCINKFYILDLRSENSYINWLLEQGYSVFIISWFNPKTEHADIDFEDYITRGIVNAINFIVKKFKLNNLNTIGYCIGGTMLATALSYMEAKGDMPVKSATFFTTLLDFKDAGDLKIFLDKEQIINLENKMSLKGYHDSMDMAAAFNLLRANEMIWQYFINNYLLGKQPFAFDLLFWNADATRLPAKMHSFYLRNMYLENNLIIPGKIKIKNIPINLKKISIPTYFFATNEDYIAPWQSCYEATKLLQNVKFVLGGSGHVAGVVNHPSKGKYYYHTNDKKYDMAENWLEKSKRHEGSWWLDWHKWQKKYAGNLKKIIRLEDYKLSIYEDAPGSYVFVK